MVQLHQRVFTESQKPVIGQAGRRVIRELVKTIKKVSNSTQTVSSIELRTRGLIYLLMNSCKSAIFLLLGSFSSLRMHRCTIAIHIFDFMQFRNWTFLISWLGFLQWFCSTTLPWRPFQALHRMIPQRVGSRGVGPDRLVLFLLLFTFMGKKDCFWCPV